ncbi:MAG: universal stress protein [Nitrospiraceae bacterium]
MMNVLVATDGSKYGRWGLNWVATLPFIKPPRVAVLHVLDIAGLRAPFLSESVMAGTERYIQEGLERMETRCAKILKETTQQLAAQKLKGRVCKEQGAVAPTISKRAPKRDGLLVVGSQGLDALDRFMLGSVSTNLIHHATCPVLVVKGEAVPVRRIILAIDGSDASAQALKFILTRFQPDWSIGKGRQAPIRVSVLHVMPFVKYPGLKEGDYQLLERSVKKLIKAGFTAEPLCQFGRPAEEIVKAAANYHTNLIVMGAQGLGAVARFLLGSVSTRVVQQANCAVLVVR